MTNKMSTPKHGETKQADFVLFDVPDYRHLFYHFGVNHVSTVIKRGRVVYQA